MGHRPHREQGKSRPVGDLNFQALGAPEFLGFGHERLGQDLHGFDAGGFQVGQLGSVPVLEGFPILDIEMIPLHAF